MQIDGGGVVVAGVVGWGICVGNTTATYYPMIIIYMSLCGMILYLACSVWSWWGASCMIMCLIGFSPVSVICLYGDREHTSSVNNANLLLGFTSSFLFCIPSLCAFLYVSLSFSLALFLSLIKVKIKHSLKSCMTIIWTTLRIQSFNRQWCTFLCVCVCGGGINCPYKPDDHWFDKGKHFMIWDTSHPWWNTIKKIYIYIRPAAPYWG